MPNRFLEILFAKFYQSSMALLVEIQSPLRFVLVRLCRLKNAVSNENASVTRYGNNYGTFFFFIKFYIQAKKKNLLSLQRKKLYEIKNAKLVFV